MSEANRADCPVNLGENFGVKIGSPPGVFPYSTPTNFWFATLDEAMAFCRRFEDELRVIRGQYSESIARGTVNVPPASPSIYPPASNLIHETPPGFVAPSSDPVDHRLATAPADVVESWKDRMNREGPLFQ
jgi:hypothetical protein